MVMYFKEKQDPISKKFLGSTFPKVEKFSKENSKMINPKKENLYIPIKIDILASSKI